MNIIMNSITKTIILLLFFMGSTVQAQPRHERIKAQKVAYITNQLELTSDEAAKFWPIYNKHEANMHQLRRKDMRNLRKEFQDQGGDAISDAEASKLLDRLITIEDKMHMEKTQLTTDLRKVISAKKIIKLRRAEEEFNKQLIKKFREGRRRN
ncbi:hypothetical protein [Spongiivirga citrea]|uniref:Sensor of ECF-type sigma factor n=1 Tax=Spongiivirga citrea TaxID=1481457 RepID=A0A6M0CNH1_9FLAO|nr:hypothetical protein [Spongiivirga citrea]NER18493.1 hypothetical protein [Spongiivirga citrea]